MKGTIKSRGKSFQVRLPYKNEYGIWTARTGTAKTKELAEAMLRKFIHEETQGLDTTNPTFEKVANEWYKEKELSGSPNTLKIYRNAKDKLIEQFGTMKIKDIKRKHISDYYASLKDSGFEVKHKRGIFNSIMLYAISSKYIMANPGREVKITRTKPEKDIVILNQAERLRLMGDFTGTIYYYPIIIVLKTGLRIGELAGLIWSNVNFKDNYIDVKQQYTRAGITHKLKSKASRRRIYLDKETKDYLLELRGSEYSTETYVLYDNINVYNSITNRLEPYGISIHDLRHNHATDLLSIMNPADAARRMGHTVQEYIRTYVHSNDDIQKQVVENLPVLNNESLRNKSRNKSEGEVVELARYLT